MDQVDHMRILRRDASRGLAKNSFDPDILTDINEPIDTLTDLTAVEKSHWMAGKSILKTGIKLLVLYMKMVPLRRNHKY